VALCLLRGEGSVVSGTVFIAMGGEGSVVSGTVFIAREG